MCPFGCGPDGDGLGNQVWSTPGVDSLLGKTPMREPATAGAAPRLWGVADNSYREFSEVRRSVSSVT